MPTGDPICPLCKQFMSWHREPCDPVQYELARQVKFWMQQFNEVVGDLRKHDVNRIGVIEEDVRSLVLNAQSSCYPDEECKDEE